MSASNHLKILSVRLPEPEIRRFKTLAASRGVSVQDAVHEAIEKWASSFQNVSREPLDVLEGSLAEVDVESLRQRERETELAKDGRWT
ncbi:MAG TPA: ribbon-helix-helix protein, CopG family [Bryobacteraceae bacterium]|jgi:hypothetical protein|nr:ribbon-helix-helix protein, CopG family [Bryobacteraceae bacterium]